MMKLSSSWPNGRMFALSDSGVSSRANFSAEFNGGSGAGNTDDTDLDTDWSITSRSRAISSPDGSTGASSRGGGGGGETNSILGWAINELTEAVAVIIGSGTGGGSGGGTKLALASAARTASRTASATAADRRNRTSVFAGCTLTSTSSSGVSINNRAAGYTPCGRIDR